MRKVSVEALKPGMRVGKPLYGIDGQLYLNRGVELKPAYIKYLKKHNFNEIYVIDERMSDVEVEEVITSQTKQEALRILKDIVKDGQKDSIARTLMLYREELKHTVEKIMREVLDQDSLMANLTDISQQDYYTLNHCVNVCVLSLINGVALDYNTKKLRELGMGAIIHDLGKMCIPHYVLNKNGSLTEDEFGLIKEHPKWGVEVLSNQFKHNSRYHVKDIVYQHHERVDGSGYPEGLTDPQINDLAKIVSIADVYDALISDRPYRKAFKPHEAVEMLHSTAYQYEMSHLNSFLNHVAAFPVGTMVKLNNGFLGLVIENKVGLPLRPVIRLVKTSQGEEILDDLDLSQELDLTIVDVVEEEQEENQEHSIE